MENTRYTPNEIFLLLYAVSHYQQILRPPNPTNPLVQSELDNLISRLKPHIALLGGIAQIDYILHQQKPDHKSCEAIPRIDLSWTT